MRPWVAALLSLALAFVLSIPSVRSDDVWETERRRVEFREDVDGFELDSDLATGAVRDRIVLRFEGPDVRFRYKLLEEANATQAVAELDVELDELVEFRDANGDGMFRPAEDDVRATYDKGQLVLGGVASEDISSAGVPGIQVTANYTIAGIPTAGLEFRATVFGDPTTFQGASQAPVEVKLDFLLDGFPFTEGNTRPAITLRADIESRFAASATTEGLAFSAGTLSAVFRWRGTAEVDGTVEPVGVVVQSLPGEGEPGEQAWGIAFAYARGASIVHDPTFGFTWNPDVIVSPRVVGDVRLFALGAVAAATLFLVLALVGRRRRVKGP